MDFEEQAALIKRDFAICRKLLVALGDETRQQIIAVLMESTCDGMRIGEITEYTRLSRPAVSHHVKILLDCGLVDVRKEGTMNFYHLDIGENFMTLCGLVNRIADLKMEAGINREC